MKARLLVALLLMTGALPAAPGEPTSDGIGYAGFPPVATTAVAGDAVLAPSYNWIKDAFSPMGEKTRFIYYNQVMVTPGPTTSVVRFGRNEQTVPNSFLVALPAREKAAAGDIVLTWWQTGSGMNRAIVVSAKDPERPVVRYLDISYDNPAKSRDGKSTIGQMEEALVPGSFLKIREGGIGSVFQCAESGRKTRWQLVAQTRQGEQLMLGFVGKMQRFSKGVCKATPLKPTVKAGQNIEVASGGAFTRAVVDRVDSKIGRVFVTLYKREHAAAFGDVLLP